MCASAISVAGFAPNPAAADVYCVDMSSSAGCDHVESPGGSAGLSAAFTAANASAAADTIEVGAGTYTGPFSGAAAGGSLTLSGAGSSGASVTTLTVTSGGQTALTLGASDSSARHLHLQLPNSTGDTGLDLDGTADDVVINDPDGSSQAIGVEMDHPDTFTGTVGLANGAGSIAINRTANGTGAEIVHDSTVSASQAFIATSGNWTIDHDRVIAGQHGIQALDGTSDPAVVSISDSLVHVTTTDTSTCGPVTCYGLGVSGSSSIEADRVTLVGEGQAIPGGYVLGAAAGKSAALELGSTVVSGFSPALKCAQQGGGMASLYADYSDFDTPVATSGGCAAPTGVHNLTPFAPPDFVTGGYELAWNSSLVDAGNPHTVFLQSNPTDLDGNPRIVDGTGTGTAVVDIGAFEYQRRPPTVTAETVLKAPVGAGVPFAVAKASDPDPGDTLTFTWSFDDGASATGARVTHEFATAGTHSATVTATDPTLLTATSTVMVEIVTKSSPGPGTITAPPKITKLKQSHRRWRLGSKLASLASLTPRASRGGRRPRAPVGTAFSFTLNAAAKVTLHFTRSAAGRRAHHRCVAPSRRNRGKPSCRRSVAAGRLTFAGGRAGANRITFQGRLSRHRRLKPGTYTLKLTATNATGEGTSHALTFTILAH